MVNKLLYGLDLTKGRGSVLFEHSFFLKFFISYFFYVILSLIYYRTAKANGYEEVAYLSFIPIINIYIMFLLIAKGNSDIERRASAKKMVILFTCLFIVGIILPLRFIVILIVNYLIYRIFYRWVGDKTYGIFLHDTKCIYLRNLFHYLRVVTYE